MDAEKIVWGLRLMAHDLGYATSVKHEYLPAVEAAAELIERFQHSLTRPLTPPEIAKVFSDTEHCGSTWTATAFGSIQEDGGDRRLTESEAGDVVRIYLMRGGSL